MSPFRRAPHPASSSLTLRADSDGSIATLPIDIRVTPSAAGEVALESEFPELRGAADTSFSFNLTLRNGTPDELTFGVVATAPAGWTANATVTSQAQAASAIVDAGGTTAIKVDVDAPDGVEAGVYPISVDATSGTRTAHADLSVEVTGSYELELTTPDGRLSANASAGSRDRPDAGRSEHGHRPGRGRLLLGSRANRLGGHLRARVGHGARGRAGRPGHRASHAVGQRDRR